VSIFRTFGEPLASPSLPSSYSNRLSTGFTVRRYTAIESEDEGSCQRLSYLGDSDDDDVRRHERELIVVCASLWDIIRFDRFDR